MSQVFDDNLKEFLNSELESINSDKVRISEEKMRIRLEINNLFEIDCLKRTESQKENLDFMQNYYYVLIEQYGLLCKRDIAIFQLIGNIGETARMESQGARASGVLENKETEENADEEYNQVELA